MQAVFLFLLIVTAASIISRLGHASLFLRFLIAPVFFSLGYFFSNRGIGILTPDRLKSLELFAFIGLSWLGTLLGLRSLIFHRARPFVRRLRLWGQITVSYFISFILTAVFVTYFIYESQINIKLLAYVIIFVAAVVMGRTLLVVNPMRINSFHAAIVAILGLGIFSGALSINQTGVVILGLVPLGAALLAALFCVIIVWLIFSSVAPTQESLMLIFITSSALLAGASLWLFVPIIFTSFIFGLVISFHTQLLKPVSRNIFHGEQTVRMVIMLFMGALIAFSLRGALLGIFFGLSLSLLRFGLHKILHRKKLSGRFFSFFMGASEIAMPVVISLWLVFHEYYLFMDFLVSFVLGATSSGDILGVMRWWHKGRRRKSLRGRVSAQEALSE